MPAKWYRDACAQHESDLGKPQAFPLTGDGAETGKIIPWLLPGMPAAPSELPSRGELMRARYRDWLAGRK